MAVAKAATSTNTLYWVEYGYVTTGPHSLASARAEIAHFGSPATAVIKKTTRIETTVTEVIDQ